MALSNKTKKIFTTVIPVSILYVSSAVLILWLFMREWSLLKNMYLFPSLDLSFSMWIHVFIILPAIFVIMTLLAITLISAKSPLNTIRNWVTRITHWVLFVGVSILFAVVGFVLAFGLGFQCVSHTTDLNNYLVFDSVDVQRHVADYFPTKETVDLYLQEGADVSYEYSLSYGNFDSENLYSVRLDVDNLDDTTYRTLKNELEQRYSGSYIESNGYLRIVVREDYKRDIDDCVFSVISYIEFDDIENRIVYSAVQKYPLNLSAQP